MTQLVKLELGCGRTKTEGYIGIDGAAKLFFSGATVCEFDKNGRINITSPLVSYAGLTKECVIIGVNDRLEIWSEDAFNSFMEDNASELEEIAEHLFEVNDAL